MDMRAHTSHQIELDRFIALSSLYLIMRMLSLKANFSGKITHFDKIQLLWTRYLQCKVGFYPEGMEQELVKCFTMIKVA